VVTNPDLPLSFGISHAQNAIAPLSNSFKGERDSGPPGIRLNGVGRCSMVNATQLRSIPRSASMFSEWSVNLKGFLVMRKAKQLIPQRREFGTSC
jgi:hypothetical protein